MRALTALCIVGTSAALLGGCGSGDPEPATDQTRTSMTTTTAAATTPMETGATTAPDGSAIPDGVWSKRTTEADAIALGIPRERLIELFGADGWSRIELRVKGQDVAQYGEEPDGTLVLGDSMTSAYDRDGNLVLTSRSEGCPGCVATFGWTVKDDVLTLRLLDAGAVDVDPSEIQASRLVMEGTFRRG